MWDDIKRLARIILSHLREQKEVFLYKLIIVNYGGSRESSLSRLGERYYQAYKDGKITDVYDEQMAAELDVLLRAEEEIEKTRRELEDIRARYVAERKAMMEQKDIWSRAGESFRPAPRRPPAPTKDGEK